MIYLGWWSQHDIKNKTFALTSILQQHIDLQTSFIVRKNLVLVYGKQHPNQDMDQVWDNDSSILLGRIFDRERFGAITPQEFSELAQKFTQGLPKKIWGKYVYWHMDATDKLSVMVDPTGQLPCFYYSLPGGDLIFSSNIELIQRYLMSPLGYNWHYLCSYLFYGNSSSIQTPFKGVEEIPPGCVLNVISNTHEINSFWNPFTSYGDFSLTSMDAVDVLDHDAHLYENEAVDVPVPGFPFSD
ncbi:MAG: hypothetical protein EBT45_06950, partial [Alphaproteobacteria bacterium]|nr:hypothetical protein [Alphaproteobacteria bacterium]